MREKGQRILGYSGAVAVVGALIWAGFVRKNDPDVLTMLGSADVQLRLASGMPANDDAGEPVRARQELIDAAGDWLDRADAVAPGMTSTCEYRAYMAYLQGDYADAATLYGAATTRRDCTPRLRASLHVKQSRMLLAAGQAADAIAVLDGSAGKAGKPTVDHQLTRAKALLALGRKSESIETARAAEASAGAGAQSLIDIGGFYEQVGETERAAAAYRAASQSDELSNYFLARLKLRQGEIDRCFELLEKAARAGASRVQLLAREDRADWQQWYGKARFEEVFRPADEAAQPGR